MTAGAISDVRPADVAASVRAALAGADRRDAPYRHWLLTGVLPETCLADLRRVNVPAPALDGVSGKRELHNDERSYFDAANMARHASMRVVAEAFQSSDLVADIAGFCGADLADTFLRIEYAVDETGFWLEPHSDLGVKRLTLLIYISDEPGQDNLGTDIYNHDRRWVGRTPFEPNFALLFVPGAATFHGFERRPIAGRRRTLIVNYVTPEWRDREQLAFPETPVAY